MLIPITLLRPLRATLGALLGIVGTAVVSRAIVNQGAGQDAMPWLVAPMGASAVLLFAVPASPLAGPWNAMVGNVLSALVGVGCASWISSPIWAGATAVALAVGVMGLCRCTHPPGGAVALTAVLGGPAIHSLGWSYVLWPIALNTTLLLAAAWLYGQVSGSPYPHRSNVTTTSAHGTNDPLPLLRTEGSDASIKAVLDAQPDALDISRTDLVALVQQIALASGARRWSATRCDTVMSRDVISVPANDTRATATRAMEQHGLNILPIVDDQGRPIGVLRPASLFCGDSDDSSVIATLPLSPPVLASPHTRVPHLIDQLLVRGAHELLVVDHDGRLIGLVTAADLLPLTVRAPLRPLGRRVARRRRRA